MDRGFLLTAGEAEEERKVSSVGGGTCGLVQRCVCHTVAHR